MKIYIDTTTTRNKYQGHGVGTYTANMLRWLPRVSRTITIATLSWKNCDVYLQPSFYDGFPFGFRGLKVVMVHDLTLLKFNYFSARGQLVNWLRGREYRLKLRSVKKADLVLTNSENTRQDVIGLLKIPSYKVKAILLGLKELNFSPCVQNVGQPCDPYLLYVGGVEFNKNIVRLIKAFAQVKRDLPEELKDLRLVLAGKGFTQRGRPESELILEEITNQNLEADVIRPGYVPEEHLGCWYADALAFVYPSFYEGFGFPVLEAMASGTPVVTSKSSSLPEVGGESVVYFDPYQLEDIRDKILSVITDYDLQVKLKKIGQERAKMFTWGRTASRTFQVISSFLGSS